MTSVDSCSRSYLQGNIEKIKHLDTQFQNSQGIVTHHIYDCRNQKTITIDESEQYRHHSITRKRDAQLSCQTSSGNSVSVPNCFLCFLEPFCLRFSMLFIMDQALTPNCLRFSMLFRTFLLLPVQHNSHTSYIHPVSGQCIV